MKDLIQRLKQQPKHGQTLNRDGTTAAREATTSTPSTNTLNDQVQQLAQQLANEIIAEQQQAQILARNGRVFT